MKPFRKAAAALLLCALLPAVAITQTPQGPQRIKINQLPIGTVSGTYITICDNLVNTYACTYNQVAAWFNANLNLILPTQTGLAGDCLGTNGTTASWIACGGGGGGGGNVSSSGTPVPGQLAQWTSSTTISGQPLTGDCTISGAGVITCTKTNGTNFGDLAGANAATPPALGGTSPAAGAFSTLSATSNLSTNITGLTQCVRANSSGVLSGTGSDCGGGGGGGSGTVNSATAGNIAYYATTGAAVSGAAVGPGLALASGVLGGSQATNAQTGTSYAITTGDAGKLVTFSNASPIAVTLARANTAGFTAGFAVDLQNLGLGNVTVTPTTSTVNGSATLAIGHNTGCTLTSDGTNYQVSACTAVIPTSAGTGLTNQVDACTYAGVDPTGVTDSLAGFSNALAANAGTNQVLFINCPIKLAIGNDVTKPVFVPNATNLAMGPTGKFIVDNAGIPVFVFMSTQGGVWQDVRFQYVGSLPVASNTYASTFNDGQMKTYMTNVLGNTFSSSSGAYWTGPTNGSSMVRFVGNAAHISFIRPKFFVPAGVTPDHFIPVCVEFSINWLPGIAVGNTNLAPYNPATPTYFAYPSDINFIDPVMDGYYMGFLGGGSIVVQNPRFYRYGDLQDAAGANQGGVGTWFAPPHAMYWNEGDPSFGNRLHVSNGYDYGPYVGPTQRRTTVSGFLTSIKFDPSNGGVLDGWTSYRPEGGVLVVGAQNNPQGGSVRNILSLFDTSIQGNNSVTGSTGGLGFPNNCNNNVTVENVTLVDLAAASTFFPFFMPPNPCNSGISIQNLKLYLNDWPAGATWYPGPNAGGDKISIQMELYLLQANSDQTFRGTLANQSGIATNSNFDYKIFGWRQFTANFSSLTSTGGVMGANWGHITGTYKANFSDGESRYVTFTNGNATPGSWTALAGSPTTAASGDGTTATISIGGANYSIYPVGTPVTVSGVTPAGYNGTYTVTASSAGSVSYANTTTGAQSVAGTVLPNTVVTVGGALSVSYSNYSQRVLVGQGGKGYGTRARVVDVSNGWEAQIDNGIQTTTWTQSALWTPAAGATSTMPLTFPNNWSIDRWGYFPQVAFTAPTTSINVGLVGGSATALLTGAGITNTDSVFPTPTPVASNNGALLLTSVGGNFSGTGTLWFSVRGSQMTAAP